MNSTTLLPAPLAEAAPGESDLVARLRDSALFQDYRDAFQNATGLPLVLRAAGSFQTPLQGSKRLNPFCALMAEANKTCAACLQLQQRIEDEATSGSKTLECFAGLNESAVPVKIGERVVAYLQTGQIMLKAPTQPRFQRALKQLGEWNDSLDEPRLRAAYFKTRVLTRPHYEAILRLLSSFAQHLSLLSNEVMITQATAEPPMIARARAHIAAHLAEDLTLVGVAQAVHVSPTYFCKLFKQATGINFTDYVARVRVESTKQLLLNPHKRISEAAYEAGFQSLSQFNRVFRRVAGESPTCYRDRIHGPAHTASLARAA
ncbi:MAG TPA: PocR ligand-binding domain-containing protein [Opitutaceae bacterium]|nr:PocR ligand-binding domain-containing protein [Opitutaceae bacterium]